MGDIELRIRDKEMNDMYHFCTNCRYKHVEPEEYPCCRCTHNPSTLTDMWEEE